MAGKAEVGGAGAARGEQILDRPVGRLADHEAVDLEAGAGSASSSTSNTSPRAGVTLGQAISRLESSIGSIAPLMARA